MTEENVDNSGEGSEQVQPSYYLSEGVAGQGDAPHAQ